MFSGFGEAPLECFLCGAAQPISTKLKMPKKCSCVCSYVATWHGAQTSATKVSGTFFRNIFGPFGSEGLEWGVGSVVVESAFWGRPDFQSRGLKTLTLKGFGAIWGKNLGRPKNADPTTTDPTPHSKPSDWTCYRDHLGPSGPKSEKKNLKMSPRGPSLQVSQRIAKGAGGKGPAPFWGAPSIQEVQN